MLFPDMFGKTEVCGHPPAPGLLPHQTPSKVVEIASAIPSLFGLGNAPVIRSPATKGLVLFFMRIDKPNVILDLLRIALLVILTGEEALSRWNHGFLSIKGGR